MKNTTDQQMKIQTTKRMIVKVQVSLFTTEDFPMVLVYDKTRRKQYEGVVTKDIKKLMKGESKKFFFAKLINKEFVLEEEAPWQSW